MQQSPKDQRYRSYANESFLPEIELWKLLPMTIDLDLDLDLDFFSLIVFIQLLRSLMWIPLISCAYFCPLV